jgi:L-lactate dehydrogenase complex protein LldF
MDLHARFVADVRRAIDNPQLRVLLDDVTGRFVEKRAAAVRAVPEWEAFRDEARRIKEEALAHLDRHLLEFERQVVARGGQVHWAATADQARRHVLAIARAHGVARMVKSKSMVSEEVHLNEWMAAHGIAPVETDFGEWIIQLAGERPSHVIAPAIHKSRGDVGRLFAEKLGIPETDDIETLTREARRHLRREFCSADLGMSGANFLVAETGTIVVVENEGNARLTTTAPPVHVVLAGIEKVIPRAADLAVFLALLPRSATGQPMSSYVSLMTGPRRAGETDGPDELHVVLIDNGRSRLLADAAAREALSCIRCGACQNVCPVYRHIGGHAYETVYAGPIGALVSAHLDRAGTPPDLPFASTLCGACADVCPVKIDIPTVLLHLRDQVMRGHLPDQPLPARWLQRLAIRAWASAMASPGRYRLASKLLRLATRIVVRGGRIRALPGPFGNWTRFRDFPVPARKTFHQLWKERKEGTAGHV